MKNGEKMNNEKELEQNITNIKNDNKEENRRVLENELDDEFKKIKDKFKKLIEENKNLNDENHKLKEDIKKLNEENNNLKKEIEELKISRKNEGNRAEIKIEGKNEDVENKKEEIKDQKQNMEDKAEKEKLNKENTEIKEVKDNTKESKELKEKEENNDKKEEINEKKEEIYEKKEITDEEKSKKEINIKDEKEIKSEKEINEEKKEVIKEEPKKEENKEKLGEEKEKKEEVKNEEAKEKEKNEEVEESKGFNKEAFISQIEGNMQDKYEIIKVLGSGAFARCIQVKNKTTGNLYACKEIQKKKMADLEGFKYEINILIKLDHPNIIKLYEIYESEDHFYLIMELCSGGELFDRIIQNIESGKPFTEEQAALIFQQMMSAINYCHKNNIVHRDLKPENLLCLDQSPNSPIKVIDFGMSKICDPNDIMFEKVGTAYYISPEVLDGMYDEKCDVWSAGVILYILLCGYPCFNGETDEQIYKQIKKKKFDFPSPEWDVISDDAKNLIKKMLSDSSERLSAEEVLKDPWVVQHAPNAKKEGIVTINENQLKNYAASSKMRKAVLTYIASRLTQNEIEELNKTFQEIDDNNDGKLTLEEIKTAINRNKNINIDHIEEIFKSIDTDGSGSIEYTEFISAFLDKSLYLKKEKLREAFSLFDVDHSGKINNEEIAKVLGMNKKSKEIRTIIEKYDRNKDGEIDFDEFFEMMKDLS